MTSNESPPPYPLISVAKNVVADKMWKKPLVLHNFKCLSETDSYTSAV